MKTPHEVKEWLLKPHRSKIARRAEARKAKAQKANGSSSSAKEATTFIKVTEDERAAIAKKRAADQSRKHQFAEMKKKLKTNLTG